MSAMDYYRTLSYLDKHNFSLEEIYIGLEEGKSIKERFLSLVERIKSLLKRIKEFVTGGAKKVHQGIRYMLDKLFKRKPLTDKQYKLLNKTDRLILLKNILIGINGRTVNYINEDGTVLDFDQYNKLWNSCKESIVKILDKEDTTVNDLDTNIINNIRSLVFRESSGLNVDDGDSFRKIKLDQLEKLLDKNTLNKMSSELPSLEKDMRQLVDKGSEFNRSLEKVVADEGYFTDNFNKLSSHLQKYQTLQGLIQCKMKYYHSIIGLNRIFSHELREGFIFSEPLPSGTKLYHLSDNGNLGNKLHPKYPKSGDFKAAGKKYGISSYFAMSDQILPKRISFSPSMEGAVNGSSFYAKTSLQETNLNGNISDDQILTYELYLYEGIPDKETQHIKPEYVKGTVADYELSKEICITTSIEIKKLGKVRITLDNKDLQKARDHFGDEFNGIGKLVKYEFIEKN